jgi:hypothetical protein
MVGDAVEIRRVRLMPRRGWTGFRLRVYAPAVHGCLGNRVGGASN